ncbi:uncharacterized protein SPPG_04616 [Spizellomyces punctatus DAOM BR117]|uniref:WIBG Mago-binding domain-containing protein n=1 Tax=Spizellomyces punctatus (strain DAOM BR117) TaxID=645134 RepID=A0A0L0HGT3_SPIPD|nr:uncharacterized protein SPPG_04616 [Spizellomyces punctatus DAOM BR117]KND00287.1 hypothetical protein SPPG_04616 [Spizellomyces punctatus DAOM BR117]|eukprot:XP_016608326.1 hypothetical protein SPPG_04616 [Spizellomyces punctatus DAOM BR117]
MSIPPVSGIRESQSGDRVIPATRRPDGSVRKERKVRPGYVPQEDVSRYTNAKVEATRVPEGYVPGIGVVQPSEASTVTSKSAKKNAKRRAKKAGEKDQQDGPAEKVTTTPDSKALSDTPAKTQATAPVDIEKKLKNLRKKLRQIEELQEKQAKGGNLIQEQRDKLSGKKDVEKEIAELEQSLKGFHV